MQPVSAISAVATSTWQRSGGGPEAGYRLLPPGRTEGQRKCAIQSYPPASVDMCSLLCTEPPPRCCLSCVRDTQTMILASHMESRRGATPGMSSDLSPITRSASPLLLPSRILVQPPLRELAVKAPHSSTGTTPSIAGPTTTCLVWKTTLPHGSTWSGRCDANVTDRSSRERSSTHHIVAEATP